MGRHAFQAASVIFGGDGRLHCVSAVLDIEGLDVTFFKTDKARVSCFAEYTSFKAFGFSLNKYMPLWTECEGEQALHFHS